MKVGIIGLGLIGGSLGLDLVKKGVEVFGVSRKEKNCSLAIKKKMVNSASTEFEILRNVDIVFICTPIDFITNILKLIIPSLNSETIVTDVASVKMGIVNDCSQLWHNFIGGHPMAGTAQQGIEAAQFNLFKDTPYVLTPIKSTAEIAIKKVKTIAELIESNIYICDPEIHDRSVALISHLPVMISTNLITTCLEEKEKKVLELAKNLASSGFRDTSRVGGGNVELGLMMVKSNRQEVLHYLKQYRKNLDVIIKQIETENWQDLEQILTINHKARSNFL